MSHIETTTTVPFPEALNLSRLPLRPFATLFMDDGTVLHLEFGKVVRVISSNAFTAKWIAALRADPTPRKIKILYSDLPHGQGFGCKMGGAK